MMVSRSEFMLEKIIHKLAKNLTRHNAESALHIVSMAPKDLAKKFVAEAYEYAPAEVLVSATFERLEKSLAY